MAQGSLRRVSRTIEIQKSPAELWPILSATDRLNREWGLPAVTYKPKANPRGGSDLKAEAKAFGKNVSWDEQPYEWIEPVLWSVRREFANGPLKYGIFGLKMEKKEPAGTLVTFFCDYEPNGVLNSLLARFALNDWLRKAIYTAHSAEDFLNRKAPIAFARRYKRHPVDRAALAEGIDKLIASGIKSDLAKKLMYDLEMLPEEDVVRMRPFDVAKNWNAERLEVLQMFMRAVRFGVLDLLWQTVCPHCRGSSTAVGQLKLVRSKSRCDFCNVDFDSEFDRSVEATFSVNASIRNTQDALYCIGGPGKTPHIHAQVRLNPGEKREIKLPLKPGNYRLRCVQFKATQKLLVQPGERVLNEALPVPVADDKFDGPESVSFAPGDIRIALDSRAKDYVDIKIERADWLDNIATGVIVTTLPEFYDLTTKELVLPDEELSVRSVTLLFSDLRGSTAMYKQFGDAVAYSIVREHFKVMESVIRQHEGGIVKTIGDAVMAVFPTATRALECCFETQKAFVELWRNRPQTIPIVVKLGFHRGPCIVVDLNNRIDYFGQTANLAARVQHQSHGGDIVFSKDIYDEPAIQELLLKYQYKEQKFTVGLKGISDEVPLVRITPSWAGRSLPQGTIIAVKPVFDKKTTTIEKKPETAAETAAEPGGAKAD